MAHSLSVLARVEDRSRTQIVNRAIKHYLETFYPQTRRLDIQVQLIYGSLIMWIAAVRSELLWTDEQTRTNALSKLAQATEESVKLALYSGPLMDSELRKHTYHLAAHLLELRALQLEEATRPEILELALKAEKEVNALRHLTKQTTGEGQVDDAQPKRVPPPSA